MDEHDLAERLRSLHDDVEPVSAREAMERVPTRSSGHRVLVASVLLVIVGVAGVAAWLLFSDSGDSDTVVADAADAADGADPDPATPSSSEVPPPGSQAPPASVTPGPIAIAKHPDGTISVDVAQLDGTPLTVTLDVDSSEHGEVEEADFTFGQLPPSWIATVGGGSFYVDDAAVLVGLLDEAQMAALYACGVPCEVSGTPATDELGALGVTKWGPTATGPGGVMYEFSLATFEISDLTVGVGGEYSPDELRRLHEWLSTYRDGAVDSPPPAGVSEDWLSVGIDLTFTDGSLLPVTVRPSCQIPGGPDVADTSECVNGFTVSRGVPATLVDVVATARADAAATDRMVALPDVTGLDTEMAVRVLEELGFAVVVQAAAIADVVPGTVISVDPRPGSNVPVGTEVTLTVGAASEE